MGHLFHSLPFEYQGVRYRAVGVSVTVEDGVVEIDNVGTIERWNGAGVAWEPFVWDGKTGLDWLKRELRKQAVRRNRDRWDDPPADPYVAKSPHSRDCPLGGADAGGVTWCICGGPDIRRRRA